MMRSSSPFPVLASVVLLAVILTAERPRYGGTIRIETQAAMGMVEPGTPRDAAEAALRDRVVPLVFETLVSVDPNVGLRPVLASSWAADAAGARWRFTIRPGVTLHDGTALDPGHVARSLRARFPAAQVETVGADVIVDMGMARPDLLWELADSAQAIAARSAAGDPIGTGPFRVERLETARLLLRAHDAYWGSRAFLDGVSIEFNRPLASQVASLETDRADLVTVRPIDVRRVTQRQLRVAASRPVELVALVFEAHRTAPLDLPLRRTLAAAIDRAEMVRVLLQGYGVAGEALLPAWLSGYPAFVVDGTPQRLSRTAILGLPLARRSLVLRVTAGDAVAQAVADRIAVDAREAGFTIRVQAPTGLAPRADLRLLRLPLTVSSPDRVLTSLMATFGPRTLLSATRAAAPAAGAPLEAVASVERDLMEESVIVPVVHLPALYAVGDRVQSFQGPVVLSTGGWNLANVWLEQNRSN